jgi:hypothetical protein
MSSNTEGIIKMLCVLDKECLNASRIAVKAGLHEQTVHKYLGLLKENKLIRIGEWHKAGGKNNHWLAYYEWNPLKLPDAPKPKPLTGSQKTQAYRSRKAATF